MTILLRYLVAARKMRMKMKIESGDKIVLYYPFKPSLAVVVDILKANVTYSDAVIANYYNPWPYKRLPNMLRVDRIIAQRPNSSRFVIIPVCNKTRPYYEICCSNNRNGD